MAPLIPISSPYNKPITYQYTRAYWEDRQYNLYDDDKTYNYDDSDSGFDSDDLD